MVLVADPTPHLERARTAIATQDYAAARDALIEAWRLQRSPAIATLVDVVAERAPDALATQLAQLVTPRVATTHGNLRLLLDHDDPRLSGWAIDALLRLPFTARTARGFLAELIGVVDKRRDARLVPHVDAIVAGITTRINLLGIRQELSAEVRRVAATLEPLDPPPLVIEIAKLVEPLRKAARSADALLADIYANPDDDGPRLVYADLLLERGDPRGELITLQLERGDGQPTPREQELLKKHGRQWLGALTPALSWGRGYSHTRFRRGFVATADIIMSVGKKLDPIRRDPAWSTVEDLQGSWDLELLLQAPLRALRVITRNLAPDELAQLARRKPPLDRVTKIWIAQPRVIDPSVLRAAFPNLTTVAMYRHAEGSSDLDVLGTLANRVEITNNWVRGDVDEAVRAFERYVNALVGTPAPMAELLLDAPRGAPALLRRDARGRFQRV